MAKKFHKGRYTPRNPQKYRGDISNIIYRSSWEAATMYWLDMNPKVLRWSSEEFVIPYLFPPEGPQSKVHRYFIDFWIETTDGTMLIEVKPQRECMPPKTGRGRKRVIVEAEALTYAQNEAKWKAAEQYATKQGYKFYVWDEVTLRTLGVVLPGRT